MWMQRDPSSSKKNSSTNFSQNLPQPVKEREGQDSGEKQQEGTILKL